MAEAKRTNLDKSRKLNRGLHLREIKDDRELHNETVGADLRAARLRMGQDLASVGEALHIKVANLRAIEEGDIDALPGPTYALGFVRSYAEFVGLGPEECIRRFKAEVTKRSDITFNSLTRNDEEKFPVQSVLVTIVVIALVVLGWFIASLALKSDPGVTPNLKVSLPQGPDVNEVSFGPIVPAQTSATQNESPGLSAAGTQNATPLKPSPLPIDDQVPVGTAWGSENHDGRLRLRAREDVWLRLESEDRVLFERSLVAGDSYQPPNSSEVIIVTRNAGALDLFVDGAYFGPIGRPGVMVAGLVLKPEDLARSLAEAQAEVVTPAE